MPKAIARVLGPLDLKCSGLVCEPFQWSGGRYKELSTKSAIQSLVESFRAILLSDVFGKVVKGCLRAKTVDFSCDLFRRLPVCGEAQLRVRSRP